MKNLIIIALILMLSCKKETVEDRFDYQCETTAQMSWVKKDGSTGSNPPTTLLRNFSDKTAAEIKIIEDNDTSTRYETQFDGTRVKFVTRTVCTKRHH